MSFPFLKPAFAADPHGPVRGEDLDGLWVATRQGQVRVAIAEIDWIEAAKDYVLLHTPGRRHIHRITMNTLEQSLNARRMLRVHRSAFVNPDRVEAINRLSKGTMSLVLRGGVAVPVGPTYVKAVQERLGLAGRGSNARLEPTISARLAATFRFIPIASPGWSV